MSRLEDSAIFRPTDEILSDRQKSQIQAHRLLFLLGSVLCLSFIPLFEIASPGTLTPKWDWGAVSGLLAGVFAASYLSVHVRRHYAAWIQGASFIIIGWFLVLSAHNGFRSNYEIGLLLLHAIFTVIAGIGARTIGPVLRFALLSVLATAGAVIASPATLEDEAVLLGALATVALVLTIAIQRLISIRKQLQERESRLRGLANSIPGVVFQFYARSDGTRGSYFVSEHAEDVLGLPPDPNDFYDRVIEGIPASHRDDAIETIEETIRKQIPLRLEFPFEKPSGEYVWLLGTSAPRVEEDEVVFNGVLLDITERRHAEAELQRTKSRYQTLVENFPRGGVFLFDDTLQYTLAGGAELEAIGLSASDIEGATAHDLFPDDLAEETEHYYRRALNGEVHSFEQTYQGKHYQILTLPVRGSGGTVVSGMAVSLDITARKEQERALREAKEEAERSSQVKTAMLANMSHEVRTPLTSIIGFSELLKDNLNGRLEEFAERTHESSQRLSDTLESILQLSKLEAGAAALEREPVGLVAAVQETVALLRPTAEEKDLALVCSFPESDVEGLWNEDALRRITRNLLENAIKFTPKDGSVTVRVRQGEGTAILQVEDTGIGISEDLLPNIFQAFRQESEGLDREYQGSGLGLSIVDHLVDELGGTVEVQTQKGEGTCFTVQLPLHQDGAPT